MTISYAIRRVSRVVLSHGRGDLSDDDFHDHYEQLRYDGRFQPYFDEICDLSAMTALSTSRGAFHMLALASPFERCARRAFVVRPGRANGLARGLASLDDLPAAHIIVVHTLDEAERWLRR